MIGTGLKVSVIIHLQDRGWLSGCRMIHSGASLGMDFKDINLAIFFDWIEGNKLARVWFNVVDRRRRRLREVRIQQPGRQFKPAIPFRFSFTGLLYCIGDGTVIRFPLKMVRKSSFPDSIGIEMAPTSAKCTESCDNSRTYDQNFCRLVDEITLSEFPLGTPPYLLKGGVFNNLGFRFCCVIGRSACFL
ncbi:TPA: hypothetical protein HA281_00950 [Candidatus Woesearchaeota archaeon]|nr:hypothetical protein [Candidatus Woesearchaeota archaeon]HII64339.1 hypothetical protein [Candidatus Woesearchaeota archaeon]HIJ19114.1 hypothetical protein [Candidatus Woesearchaeota archaeon]